MGALALRISHDGPLLPDRIGGRRSAAVRRASTTSALLPRFKWLYARQAAQALPGEARPTAIRKEWPIVADASEPLRP